MANDESKDKQENPEDSFGLPDIEYKPLEQPTQSTQPESTQTSGNSQSRDSDTQSTSQYAYTEDEPKSKGPLILTIVIILVIAIAGYLVYNYVWVPRQLAAEAKKKEQARIQAEARKRDEEARIAKLQEEAEKRRLDSIARATPPVGTIEMLNARTKRYYVVVTSDIDDDLLMDYAKKLSAKGISTKVIPPFGGRKFYRLAIADHETYALAQTNADAVKTDYGSGVWVIKY